jgi:single-stranded-DNA-specific exonuclease
MDRPPAERAEPALLGVESSVASRRWRARSADDRLALALAQRLALPEMVGRILAARQVALDTAADFLQPTLRQALPDPAHLKDMGKAVARLVAAVRGGERIAVFGDYDVDGATATALLVRFFTAVDAATSFYIPDRVREGYGPNAPALLELKRRGAAVAITVDCGVTAHEPLAAAAAAGLDVIVVDHHVAESRLPPALAVVDPNRLDETSPHRQLAAVGVAFLLAVAVNRGLREAGWYAARAEPDLMRWLDLVALGTVCDVVPLTGVNRALVAQGLKVMGRRGNPGLAALADVAGLDQAPEAYHAGFVLGPRVNAGGRVGEAWLGARLLGTDDPVEARRLAERLDAFNRERQAIEAGVLAEALDQAEGRGGAAQPVLFAAGRGWHVGVVGIVASRLAERYHRPACVVGLGDGVGRGSARSVAGVDIGAAVLAARQAGLLVNGGGHPMAAGFTVAEARLAALRRFLAERVAAQTAVRPLRPELRLDGVLQPAAATPALADQLARLGPFGVGNPRPRFALPNVRLVRAEVVGDGHLRCLVTGEGGGRLKAIAFRAMDGPLGQMLRDRLGAAVHLAGHLRPDNWQGREAVQLVIEDAAPAYGAG